MNRKGQSLHEILKSARRNGPSLERENLKIVLEEIEAVGVVRSASVHFDRCCCLEVA